MMITVDCVDKTFSTNLSTKMTLIYPPFSGVFIFFCVIYTLKKQTIYRGAVMWVKNVFDNNW
jgi:hypothetical protein